MLKTSPAAPASDVRLMLHAPVGSAPPNTPSSGHPNWFDLAVWLWCRSLQPNPLIAGNIFNWNRLGLRDISEQVVWQCSTWNIPK
jgi:hypothetical protein